MQDACNGQFQPPDATPRRKTIIIAVQFLLIVVVIVLAIRGCKSVHSRSPNSWHCVGIAEFSDATGVTGKVWQCIAKDVPQGFPDEGAASVTFAGNMWILGGESGNDDVHYGIFYVFLHNRRIRILAYPPREDQSIWSTPPE